MSSRSGTPAMPLPSGPIAVTLTDDCDPPSWLIASGIASSLSDSARPDGPVNGGASLLLTVQPATANTEIATAMRRIYVKAMMLLIPKITELDRHLPGRLDRVAGPIRPVERNHGNRRQEV